MNKRDLRLENYGISNKRYKELCGFCEQYPEWKEKLKYDNNALKSVEISDMPHSPNRGTSDTTGNLAVKLAEYSSKCALVEEVAKEAAPDVSDFLIALVCYGVSYPYLLSKGLYMSQSVLYDRRRYFFYLLDQKKQ